MIEGVTVQIFVAIRFRISGSRVQLGSVAVVWCVSL